MMKMQKILRQENENIIKLKGICPDNRLPRGLLLEGEVAVKGAVNMFQSAKTHDIVNEKIPDLEIVGNGKKAWNE